MLLDHPFYKQILRRQMEPLLGATAQVLSAKMAGESPEEPAKDELSEGME